jgi:hypothetical protein
MNFVAPLLRFVIEADVGCGDAGRPVDVGRSDRRAAGRCLRQPRGAGDCGCPFNSGLLARRMPGENAHFDYGLAPADVLTFAR